MSDDMLNRFNQIFAVAPQLVVQPELAVPLASAGADIGSVESLASFQRGRQIKDFLEGLSDEQEIEHWDQLSRADKSLARIGGYREQMLRKEEEDKKSWGKFFKQMASVATSPLGAIGPNLGDAIDVAWDYSIEKPVERAGMLLDAVTPDAVVDPVMGTAGDVGGWALDNTVGTVLDSGKMIGGQLLDVYGDATSFIDQVWRTTQIAKRDGEDSIPLIGEVAEQSERIPGPLGEYNPAALASSGLELAGGIFTGDLKRWWKQADRKNAPVNEKTLREVEKEYGEEIVQLVREQQMSPDALLQRRADLIAQGRLEDANGLDTFMNSPEFAEVSQRLGKALLSPGRKMAQDLGLSDNDTAFNLVSGLGDGTWRVASDPLLIAGKGVQGARIAAYGLPKGSAVDAAARQKSVYDLFQKRSVRNYWDGFAKNLDKMRSSTPGARQEALKDLERNYKLVNPALRESMLKAGVNDVDGAMLHLMAGEAYKMLLQGQSAVRRPLMPYRRQIDMYLGGHGFSVRPGLAVKKPVHKVIDFMADGSKIVKDDLLLLGTAIDDVHRAVGSTGGLTTEGGTGLPGSATFASRPEEAKRIASLLQAHREGFRGRTATAHRRISTKLPAVDENGMLDLMAPGASRDVGRVAAMVAPKYWAREIEAAFMQADEVGRKNIWKGLMATMGEAAGVTKTAAGRKFWDEYLGTVGTGKQSIYSATGASRLDGGRDVGLWANDMSSHVAVPNFAELWAQSAKIGVADQMFAVANKQMVDLYMQSVWRPSVLLRPALPYRNSIEETLNQLIREPGALIQGKVISRAVNQRQYQRAQEAQKNAVSLKLQQDRVHAELTEKWGRDAYELEAFHASLVDEAKALREARVGAGRKGSDRPVVDRQVARNERKVEADALEQRARSLQHDINRINSARHDANLAAVKASAVPDAFDTNVGRTFRAMTSAPRAMAKILAPHAEKEGASQSLRNIYATLRNANQSLDHFYRAHVYGKLADKMVLSMSDDVQRYVEELVDNPYARQMFQQEIFETSRLSAGNVIDNLSVAPARPGYKTISTGEYALHSVSGKQGAAIWSNRLNYIASDKAGSHILAHIDNEYEAILGAARIIEANPAMYARRSMAMTERDSIEHATKMYQEARAMVSTREGELIPAITDKLYYVGGTGGRALNAEALSPSNLNKIDDALRPSQVVGQQVKFVENAEGMGAVVHDLTQWGFKTVGDMTAAMSRHNQFFSSYIQARQMLAPLEKELIEKMGGDAAAQLAARNSMINEAIHQSLVKSTSFVDNPKVRSQAAVLMRNFAPFYRAQEEFFARWAKTFKYNPESFGRAMLTQHAATSSGFVHRDENGELYFVYPGSGVVHSMMASVSQTLGLDLTKVPIISPMTGKVQMLTPGLNPDSSVNVFNGPILAEPLRQLARMTSNPTVDKWEKKILGPGADRGLLHANIPAILRPAYEEYALDGERHEINAMAALFAGGHGLRSDATAKEKREFLERVKGHAQGLKVIRTIFGPASPAYPRIGPEQPPSEAAKAAGMNSVRQEFYDLVKRMEGDYNGAYAFWVENHPDELPFILGQSEIEGVPFLATKAAGEFIDSNREMLQNYPLAGTFFIPKGEGDFDAEAFRLSKQLGLRKDKSAEQFLDDLLLSNGVGFYYDQRAVIDERVKKAKETGDTASAQHWEDVWSGWSNEYRALNPEVAEYLADGGRRNNEREQTLKEMKILLGSSEVPEGETAEMYRKLIRGWENHKVNLETIGDARTDYARAQKEAENQAFTSWVEKLTADSTAGKLLYNKLFRYMKP